MTRLRRLIRDACRRHRGRLLASSVCAAAAGAAAVLLLGLSGWFITAASAAGLAGAASASAFNALLPSAGIRLLAILRTGCRYGERACGHDAALRAMGGLRPTLFNALAAAPPGHALALSAGDATARLVQDVGELEVDLIQRAALWGTLAAGAAGTCLLCLAGPAPAAALALILAATLLLGCAIARRLDMQGRAVPPARGRLRQDVAAMLEAAPELRAYGLETWAAQRVAARSAELLAVQRRLTASAAAFDLLLAGAAGLAVVAAMLLARRGGVPAAAMAALGAGAGVEGVAPLLRRLQHRGRAKAAHARLGALLGAASDTRWAPMPASIAIGLTGLSGGLEPGAIIGLSGPSGCGKTRLLETLTALRAPAPGTARLGGTDVAALDPARLRRAFALVPQDARLLAGSVRENLLLAGPDLPEHSLWTALHDAVLDERIRALPRGLDSWIGENGELLSGGERRRLVIARAFLRDAPWLLLDEPSEGLDDHTEALVIRRLHARLQRSRQGAIIVSHRAAPLTICDDVVHMAADGTLARDAGRARIAA
jgi:ATP-binding cassette subfamily C protein CydC